ncbi:MAG: 2-C-methyl-D-erythritol 2,4-cyclodiphosphate synthase [Fidelibacterota bacterium]
MEIRTGIGYDLHPLAKGESLVLGGVTIAYNRGTKGHSDGDVLTHAVVDALLGAAGWGDIGKFFPSNDNAWQGVSSLLFLEKVAAELSNVGMNVVNVDCTVVLEEPKIGSYIDKMKGEIARILAMETHRISIKATTTDGLGVIGRGEGVAALAVATLKTS